MCPTLKAGFVADTQRVNVASRASNGHWRWLANVPDLDPTLAILCILPPISSLKLESQVFPRLSGSTARSRSPRGSQGAQGVVPLLSIGTLARPIKTKQTALEALGGDSSLWGPKQAVFETLLWWGEDDGPEG
jgi:hypothetical protein